MKTNKSLAQKFRDAKALHEARVLQKERRLRQVLEARAQRAKSERREISRIRAARSEIGKLRALESQARNAKFRQMGKLLRKLTR